MSFYAGDGDKKLVKLNGGFVPYIVDCVKSFQDGIMSTDSMIGNLSAAIVLQFRLLENASDKFREESARAIHSPETCSKIQAMTAYMCTIFFKGILHQVYPV